MVSVNPSVLGFSTLRGGDGKPKDTIRNLEAVERPVSGSAMSRQQRGG